MNSSMWCVLLARGTGTEDTLKYNLDKDNCITSLQYYFNDRHMLCVASVWI